MTTSGLYCVDEIKPRRYGQKERYLRAQTQAEETLKRKVTELSNKESELKHKEETIKIERYKIQKYDNLRNNKQTKCMVVLGHTGDGKSTVLNRLYGDDSQYGDQGPFYACDDVDSVTTKVNHLHHQIGNISAILVDTPGYKDTHGAERDDEHFNNLGGYLYGCGGVDAFILVMNGTNIRFDGNIQCMLKYYIKYFDIQIWNHLIIVMSRIEGYEEKQFHDKKRGELYQEKLHYTFDSMDKECVVPIIPIGYGQNYEKFRENVMKEVETISNIHGKLECQHIESPICELEQERDDLEQYIVALKKEIGNIEHDFKSAKRLFDEQQDIIDNSCIRERVLVIMIIDIIKAFGNIVKSIMGIIGHLIGH